MNRPRRPNVRRDMLSLPSTRPGPRLFVVLLVMLAVVGAGCNLLPSSEVAPEGLVLEGTTWRAVSVAGRVPPPDEPPTIAFAGGRIEGSNGCNFYGGEARLEGGRLVVAEIARTLRLCDEARNAIETAFSAILHGNNRIGLVDGRLVIAGEAGEIVLEPAS